MYHEAIRLNPVEERLHRDLRIFSSLIVGALVLDLYRQMIQVNERQLTIPSDREASSFDTISLKFGLLDGLFIRTDLVIHDLHLIMRRGLISIKCLTRSLNSAS